MLLEEGEGGGEGKGEDEEIFQSINKVISRINKNHFLKHFYIILCDQKKKLNERGFLNFKREYIGRPLSITFLIFNKIYLQRFLPNQKREPALSGTAEYASSIVADVSFQQIFRKII